MKWGFCTWIDDGHALVWDLRFPFTELKSWAYVGLPLGRLIRDGWL